MPSDGSQAKGQLAKAKLWSKDQGDRVVDAFAEIGVTGKLPLVRRPGLLRAIEVVEVGGADHVVVAYFDRLVRSLEQLEVIERVERAGGEIYAIEVRRIKRALTRYVEATDAGAVI